MKDTKEIQDDIIAVLKKDNGLYTREIIKKCDFSPELLKTELNKLRSSHLIESCGEAWQRLWYLINCIDVDQFLMFFAVT